MNKNYIILLLLCALSGNAQFYKAKLLMTDGSIKEGFAELPSNKLLDTGVKFKTSQKSNAENLSDDALEKILFTTDSGNQFLFERNSVVHLFKSFGNEVEHEKLSKHWMVLFHSNKMLNGYSLAQRYKIDKNGTLISITGAYSIWEFVYFLLKRGNETKAYIVSGKGFSNGEVRKAMEIYFKDVPEFVTRVENKEFKNSTIEHVADEYAKYF